MSKVMIKASTFDLYKATTFHKITFFKVAQNSFHCKKRLAKCTIAQIFDDIPNMMKEPTDDSGLQVHKHCPGHVLAGTGLAEEGVEGVITASDGLVTGHLAVRLNTVLQAVQLPARIADLDTGLADVD